MIHIMSITIMLYFCFHLFLNLLGKRKKNISYFALKCSMRVPYIVYIFSSSVLSWVMLKSMHAAFDSVCLQKWSQKTASPYLPKTCTSLLVLLIVSEIQDFTITRTVVSNDMGRKRRIKNIPFAVVAHRMHTAVIARVHTKIR